MKPSILTAGFLMVATSLSCSEGVKIRGDQENRSSSVSADGSSKDKTKVDAPTTINTDGLVNESVNPPSQVSGTLLTCSIIESSEEVEVKVGCRFENADKVQSLSVQSQNERYSAILGLWEPALL